MEQPHEEISTTDARGGAAPGVMRYVLLISMILVVVAFAAMLLIWR